MLHGRLIYSFKCAMLYDAEILQFVVRICLTYTVTLSVHYLEEHRPVAFGALGSAVLTLKDF